MDSKITTNTSNSSTSTTKTTNTNGKAPDQQLTKRDYIIGFAILAAIALFFIINHKSYEEYDLKGLTIAEACEKAKSAGWDIYSIHRVGSYSDSDKTDCYNTNLTVTGYDYLNDRKKVEILYGVEEVKSYEEYDLKGLTVAAACEKARSAGWKVDTIRNSNDNSDKTDCYNTSVEVSNYSYSRSGKTVDIWFGKKKTEEEKEAECKAQGKVYRSSGLCKSAEEWEAQDKKDAEEAKAKTESAKQQATSSSSKIDSSKSYKLATINAGESCPSNVQFCNISGNSTGSAKYGYGTMRGQIINNTGKDYSYIQITAEIYSSAGAKIGDCWGNTAGLKAGATWQYEAYCNAWGTNAKLANGNISGW